MWEWIVTSLNVHLAVCSRSTSASDDAIDTDLTAHSRSPRRLAVSSSHRIEHLTEAMTMPGSTM